MMDLKKCGFHPDVLTDGAFSPNVTATNFSWSPKIFHKHLRHTKFLTRQEHASTFQQATQLLQQYDKIFMLPMLYPSYDLSFQPLPDFLALVIKSNLMQQKVINIVDDVPARRCKRPGQVIDPQCVGLAIPTIFANWATSSIRNFAITQSDAANMNLERMPVALVSQPFAVWPLRMSQLLQLMPERSKTPPEERHFLLMLGTAHPHNLAFINMWFDRGGMDSFCRIVAGAALPGARMTNDRGSASSSRVFTASSKVLFGGEIAKYIKDSIFVTEEQMSHYSDCVELRDSVSDEELQQQIIPHTRAIFNPVLDNIGSGVSIKSYEAIANGLPLVTSSHGLNGLEECVVSPLLAAGFLPHSDSITDYIDFISTHILEKEAYLEVFSKVGTLAQACVELESEKYPQSDVCESIKSIGSTPFGP
jgi:hypothetical protein